MRRNISIVIALLCMFVQTAWAQFSGGSGTQTEPYLISSVADWNTLATNVEAGESYSGKYFKLTKDLDNVETMVGSEGKPFSGHFFGNGKALNAYYSESAQYCAPFRYVDGATITNLNMRGVSHTSAKFASGLIGQAKGNNVISDCRISTSIWSEVNGDGSHGGLIADVESGDTRIENCLYDGRIDGTDTDNCGGFVGWKRASASITFNNCLFNPRAVNVKANGSKTFVRYGGGNLVRINECYFLSHAFGFGQGYSRLGFTVSDIVNTLGNGWMESDGQALPAMNTGNVGCAYITGMEFRYQYGGTPFNIAYNVVKADGTQLTNGTDYTAVITLNTQPVTSITEDGYYLLTITGKGAYSGTKIVPFYVDNPTDIANISSDYVIRNGEIVTGELNNIVKISIADGATVTLAGITITPEGNGHNNWSGITCLGDATIILADGTENIVRSFTNVHAGICVPAGKTLTIDGTGSLDAAPNANENKEAGNNSGAAGIGGHKEYNSGIPYAEERLKICKCP